MWLTYIRAAHVLDGHVAREDVEVGVGDSEALVLLVQRLEKRARVAKTCGMTSHMSGVDCVPFILLADLFSTALTSIAAVVSLRTEPHGGPLTASVFGILLNKTKGKYFGSAKYSPRAFTLQNVPLQCHARRTNIGPMKPPPPELPYIAHT